MTKRGRRSAAELATVPAIGPEGIVTVRRPEPPDELSDEARDIWRAVCSSMPADWFKAGCQPLLAAFCTLSVSQRRVAQALERIESGEREFDMNEWRDMVRLAGELSARVSALATRLRLTPQSRYQPSTAATRVNDVPTGPKPWEDRR